MNGFDAKGLNEGSFGEKSDDVSGLKTFDAFREFHPIATRAIWRDVVPQSKLRTETLPSN